VPRRRREEARECSFCRIARGEAAAHVVLEDAVALAFLDHRPLLRGHLLLVPRAHHATLLDLPPRLVGPLFARARRLAAALERGLGAEGSFVAVNNRVSQSVPHLHVHVVPRRRGDGLRGFFWPRTRYADDADEEAVATAIRAALAAGEGDPGTHTDTGTGA
jgi:histidine triad (HIT) family protein